MRACLGAGSVLRLSQTLWMTASLALSLVRSAVLTLHFVTWEGGGLLSDWSVATHYTVDSDT